MLKVFHVMMDKEDSWLYYREDVVEKIDLNAVLNNAETLSASYLNIMHDVMVINLNYDIILS